MNIYIVAMLLASTLAGFADFIQNRFVLKSQFSFSQTGTIPHKSPIALIFFWAAAIPLICIRGFRYGIGTDYFYTYVPSFNAVSAGQDTRYEPLFQGLLKLISNFTSDYRVFFFAETVLFVSIVWIAIQIAADHFFLPVLLFTGGYDYIRSFCYVRQYLAMALCLLGVAFLIRKKPIWSFIIIGAAGFMHSSAFILLLIPVWGIFSKKIKGSVALASFVLIGAASSIPLSLVFPNLYQSTSFSVYQGTAFDDSKFGGALFVLNIFVLLLFIFCNLVSSEKLKRNDVIYLGIEVYALIFCLVQGSVPLVYRIIWFIDFFQILSVPHFLAKTPNATLADHIVRLSVTGFTITVYLLLCFAYWLPSNTDGVLPYQSIF